MMSDMRMAFLSAHVHPTQQYIALVREYAHQLGPKEARRRLVAKGDEVSAFCSWCAGDLYDAAKRY